MFKYHIDGTAPIAGEIFVFGSNLAGIHGAGAAKKALDFGAKMGYGLGLNGDTYAIPTKDQHIVTLPLWNIENFVEEFSKFTHTVDREFFVTRVGCVLAGYTDRDIAPLFQNCSVRCSFAEQWKPFLETS